MPTHQSDGNNSSNNFPSSPVTAVCVDSTKTKHLIYYFRYLGLVWFFNVFIKGSLSLWNVLLVTDGPSDERENFPTRIMS